MIRPANPSSAEMIDYLFNKLENRDKFSAEDVLLLKYDAKLDFEFIGYAQELEATKLLAQKRLGLMCPLTFEFFLTVPRQKLTALDRKDNDYYSLDSILRDLGAKHEHCADEDAAFKFLTHFSSLDEMATLVRALKTMMHLSKGDYIHPEDKGTLPN